MDDNHTRYILDLMVKGYQLSAILARCEKNDVPVDYPTLVAMFRDHYEEIAQAREQTDQETLKRGLGRKAERLRRVEDLAERIEDKAITSPEWASAYLRTIKTAEQIVGNSGLYELPETDEWVIYIRQLKQVENGKTLSGSKPSPPGLPSTSSDSPSTDLESN